MENDLPLPPHGNVLLAIQKEGIRLKFKLYIFVGEHAAEVCRYNLSEGVRGTYLPYGHSFEKYFWPVKDQEVIVSECGLTSRIAVKKMCHHLLTTYKAKCVLFHPEKAGMEYFEGEQNHG